MPGTFVGSARSSLSANQRCPLSALPANFNLTSFHYTSLTPQQYTLKHTHHTRKVEPLVLCSLSHVFPILCLVGGTRLSLALAVSLESWLPRSSYRERDPSVLWQDNEPGIPSHLSLGAVATLVVFLVPASEPWFVVEIRVWGLCWVPWHGRRALAAL